MQRFHLAGVASIAALLALHAPARAQDVPTFRLTLRDHRFEPPELTVPAGTRFILVVKNADPTPAEFESKGLGAEKIISAGREATIRVGPLEAGRYPFEDEFNSQAKGVLIAVQQIAGE